MKYSDERQQAVKNAAALKQEVCPLPRECISLALTAWPDSARRLCRCVHLTCEEYIHHRPANGRRYGSISCHRENFANKGQILV